MTRRHHGESLDVWADEHGEPIDYIDDAAPEHCRWHGDYHADPLAAECPGCIAAAAEYVPIARRLAWTSSDGADRADAFHTAHD